MQWQDLEKVFNSLEAGIVIVSKDHSIEWVNQKAAQWFGPFVEIGKKRRCYRIILYNEEFCSLCPTGRTIDTGTTAHYEFDLPENSSQASATNSLKLSSFEIIGIPIFEGDRSVSKVVELIIPLTQHGIQKIKSNEFMAQIEKMAAVGHLAAGVAHELNTPLATISIVSQELKSIIDNFSDGEISKEELKDYLSDIESEIKRCKRIISDLLNFSKKGTPELGDTDLNSLVSKAINLIQKGVGYKGVTILKDVDPSATVLKTDAERFSQVVFNILKNAIDAVTDAGSGTVSVKTSVSGCFAQVIISDTGPGISPENLEKVFEPFFTTKPVGKGTGLGLFVSYGIMKDLMGDIKIESCVGEGTRVSLLLPVN